MSTPSFKPLWSTSPHASAVGRSNRKSGTKPEIALRRALWSRGLRYRLHCADLPGRPDLVFRKQRVAVFCDGDFWHGRDWPNRRAKLASGSNAEYWVAKIAGNMERDRRVTAQLEQEGWRVVRIWEGDLKEDLESVILQITHILGSLRNS